MATRPTSCRSSSSRRATTTRTPVTSTGSTRRAASIAACTASSAPRRWPPTSWCRSTAAISACRPSACAAAASRDRIIRRRSCTGSWPTSRKRSRKGRTYRIYGYKGKQVRDNIHALDVCRFFEAFHRARGGGRGLQHRRRTRQQRVGARGDRPPRGAHRPPADGRVCRRAPGRRSHLLHQRRPLFPAYSNNHPH